MIRPEDLKIYVIGSSIATPLIGTSLGRDPKRVSSIAPRNTKNKFKV
ncbi:hypothetical protein ACLH6Q_001331 [Campylobacter fetus]|nr:MULTISPECIES: hypothetical protein [Campylobacter]EJB7568885.1 hypothetical protein [Campylobacter fetus]EKJ0129761.1 hypothetical protein [Campylobacter fetus]EKJ0131456.1 hypothetical protein [Campylobacter fetus]EKJ0567963.1 hypothetical protein [Campylobacter fetus]EKL2796433.1 hypothetical protein [Campylobacter fetus]